MDFSLRELECFLAVAEELSFTRAARRMHLAQPPLSRHVRMLEDRLGAPLFIRQPRGVALTAAGRLLYEEIRDVPARLRQAGEAVRRCALGETARLRLGFVSAVLSEDLATLCRRFRQEHPAVQLTLHDASPHDQLQGIAEGRLDGGFVGIRPAEPPPGVALVTWYREPLVCLTPRDHPLAGRRSVRLKALAEEAFLAVSREAAPDFARHVQELCRAAGFRPRIVLESPRAQAVALMVAAASGVAILPAALGRIVRDSVHTLTLTGIPPLAHVFAYAKGRESEALRHLLELLRPAC